MAAGQYAEGALHELSERLSAAQRQYLSADRGAREVAWATMAKVYDAVDVPLLLKLVESPDEWVRMGVADALGVIDASDDEDSPIAVALLRLLGDPVPRVRDFAAAGFVAHEEIDSAEIRAALFELLGQPDTDIAYPAAEAALALAKRGDQSVVEPIKSRLTEGVGRVWLDAAAAVRSPALLSALQAIDRPDLDVSNPWVTALREAIRSCRP